MWITIKVIHKNNHIDLEEERALITRSKKDVRHFEPLYEKYFPLIFRYIYRRTADEVLTADLCSDTFYKAIANLAQFTWQGKPMIAWLYRIAENELRKHFRNQKLVFTVEVDKLTEVYESSDLEPTDQNELLIKILDNLDDKELQLVELKYFEGMTFKEISTILGLTESAVKMKLYRLLNSLKTEGMKS